MKLSVRTIDILSNFAGINNSLLIQKGSHFYTRDANKTMFAVATVAEDFEDEMGIYDLQSLLQYIKLMGGTPEISVEKDFLLLDNGAGTRIRHKLADKDIIICQENAPMIKGDIFATIKFTPDNLQTILLSRNVGVTKADTVEFMGNGIGHAMRILNEENSASSIVTSEVDGEMKEETNEYSIKFKAEQFPMISGEYVLDLYKRKLDANSYAFFAKYSSEGLDYICPAKANAGAFVK